MLKRIFVCSFLCVSVAPAFAGVLSEWMSYKSGEGSTGSYRATQELLNKAIYNQTPSTVEGRKALALYRKLKKGDTSVSLTKLHQLLEVAVGEGDPEAMSILGLLLQNGIGAWPDKLQAIELFNRSRELGSGSGAYNLGVSHKEGIGVPKDLKLARVYFEQAKKRGYLLAGIALAELDYLEGSIVRAKKVLQEYVDDGYPQAYMLRAEIYSNYLSNDASLINEMLDSVRTAWRLGSTEAGYELYGAYSEGLGVQKNFVKAIGYLKASSWMGNADAKAELCLLYKRGVKELKKDMHKAYALCKDSAVLGSMLGANNLAMMHFKDDFPQKSLEKYKYWSEMACERGSAFNMAVLFANYFRGIRGYEKDLDKAFYWAKRSAESGWPEGMFVYASLLGEDVTYDIPSLDGPDWNRAWYWMTIKHALVPGERSKEIRKILIRKSDPAYRKEHKRELVSRINDFENNYWVMVYRREVERGSLSAY